MDTVRRRHDQPFEAKVALDVAKGEKLIARLFNQDRVHAIQIHPWQL